MSAQPWWTPLDAKPGGQTSAKPEAEYVISPLAKADEPTDIATFTTRGLGIPSLTWAYRDGAGLLVSVVARYPTPAGKETRPWIHARKGAMATPAWHMKSHPSPRPLYQLPELLAAAAGSTVLVTEGEKAADAAQVLFPDCIAITSAGGSSAAKASDWAAVRGHHVVILPDHDKSGRRYTADVIALCRAAGSLSVRAVTWPADFPEKWDVADPLPDEFTTEWLKETVENAPEATEPWASPSPGTEATEEERARTEDEIEETITRLAALSPRDYESVRKAEARRLNWRWSRLDEEVAGVRRENRPPPEIVPDPLGRADLHVDNAELPAVASELAKYLAHRPMLFDRAGPVRLTLDAQSDGMKAVPLTIDGTTNEAHEICRPFQWVVNPESGPSREYITLPVRVATLYLDRRDRLGLRPLDGIACAPLCHDDGSIRTAAGYDERTRLWCERVPTVTVPDAPTKADAEAALMHLRTAFRTFCFADASRVTDPAYPVPVVDVSKPPGADESAFLAGLMTAVCRPSLPLAPGMVIRAAQLSGAGTGKGMLVRAICAIAFGAAPRAMTAGHDPAELDKRIVAALIGADFALFLDNLNATALKSDALASAITERPAYVRPLGRSATVALNSAAFVAVTGNALVVSEDMARRFVTVDLDAGTENPETRPFTGDFLGGIQANRGDLLRAALIVWRWGRLQGDALKSGRPMGSFPQWARWCRDPLLALGCADPADRIATTKAQDPRRAALAELFTAWWKHHKAAAVAVSDLHDDVRALADPANRGRQYVAARIRNLAGTRLGGAIIPWKALGQPIGIP